MPKSDMDKDSVDQHDDKPSFYALIFVFITITLATVLAATLIDYAIRALFNLIAG